MSNQWMPYGGNECSAKPGQAAANIIHEKHAANFVEFIADREDALKKCIAAYPVKLLKMIRGK